MRRPRYPHAPVSRAAVPRAPRYPRYRAALNPLTSRSRHRRVGYRGQPLPLSPSWPSCRYRRFPSECLAARANGENFRNRARGRKCFRGRSRGCASLPLLPPTRDRCVIVAGRTSIPHAPTRSGIRSKQGGVRSYASKSHSDIAVCRPFCATGGQAASAGHGINHGRAHRAVRASAQAHAGRRAQYCEKIPSSTRRVTSTKPAAPSAAMMSGGATQLSIVSQ